LKSTEKFWLWPAPVNEGTPSAFYEWNGTEPHQRLSNPPNAKNDGVLSTATC
jgi:hypothetical protein